MALKIAFIGASGNVGSRIAKEAARRGHQVTPLGRADLDVLDAAQVAKAAVGHDILASAYAAPEGRPEVLSHATRSLIEGAARAGVRLVAVGGAGSALLPNGRAAVDAAPLDDPYRALGIAHKEALALYRQAKSAWTVVTPSGNLFPGTHTGVFRLSDDALLVDAQGNASISMEDYAVAFVDEMERPSPMGKRVVVGY